MSLSSELCVVRPVMISHRVFSWEEVVAVSNKNPKEKVLAYDPIGKVKRTSDSELYMYIFNIKHAIESKRYMHSHWIIPYY